MTSRRLSNQDGYPVAPTSLSRPHSSNPAHQSNNSAPVAVPGQGKHPPLIPWDHQNSYGSPPPETSSRKSQRPEPPSPANGATPGRSSSSQEDKTRKAPTNTHPSMTQSHSYNRSQDLSRASPPSLTDPSFAEVYQRLERIEADSKTQHDLILKLVNQVSNLETENRNLQEAVQAMNESTYDRLMEYHQSSIRVLQEARRSSPTATMNRKSGTAGHAFFGAMPGATQVTIDKNHRGEPAWNTAAVPAVDRPRPNATATASANVDNDGPAPFRPLDNTGNSRQETQAIAFGHNTWGKPAPPVAPVPLPKSPNEVAAGSTSHQGLSGYYRDPQHPQFGQPVTPVTPVPPPPGPHNARQHDPNQLNREPSRKSQRESVSFTDRHRGEPVYTVDGVDRPRTPPK
ncbi:hypothetical protein FRB94_013515 [Tulasnella sp. JGI-2019a]|nr:hypothetical protein FRB94_013515 [Tulasnella sp. JGI-2019a]